MTKRIFSVVLALCLVLGTMGVSVLAAETLGGADFVTNSDKTVFDGTNYYSTLADALAGVHGTDNAVLYCKPGADVGVMTHGHVCKNLTVYGNGAYVSGGEQEFELDTYVNYMGVPCSGITSELTLTVDSLNGSGAWGQRNTANVINLVFTNCEDMSRIYLSGTSGETNITVTDCTYTSNTGGNCKVYSNANGTITLNNVDFSNVDVPVNLNHKVAGTQTIILNDCDFDTCGTGSYEYAAPVRVLSSVSGAASDLSIENCSFTGTVTNAVGQNADILLDHGVGVVVTEISGTASNVVKETEANVGTTTPVAETESYENSDVVAEVDGNLYASIADAVAAITNNSNVTIYEGTYEGSLNITEENVTVIANGDVKITGEAPSLKGTNWYVEGIDFEYPNGGNIINCSGTLKNCTFTSQAHTMRYAYGTTNGNLVIDGCTFTVGEENKINNWALHFDQTYGADIEIINSSFDGRFAMTGDHNSLTITGCEFTGKYANTYNDVTYTDCTFDVDYIYTGGAGVIAKFDECETADGSEIKDVLYNEVATVVVDGNIVTTGAKIGDDIYTSLQAAVDAANPGDVIDLNGITLDLPEVNSLKITKDLTIQNGTIDITDGVWSGNSIIEVYGGTEADPVELTMNNVDVIGENYSSAFGVVYAYNHGKVTLIDCNFELADEVASAGGVLKGNGVAQSEFVVKNSTFMLENPNRVITNATVTIEDTTIDAKITDDTLAVGTMNNHALRSIEGTISNSEIKIDGFESGIKNNSGETLVIENNSTLELTNSVDADVNLDNSGIDIKEDSKLIAVNYKDDASKENVTSDETSAIVDKVAYLPEAPTAEVYAGRTLADARLTGTTVYTEVYGDVLNGVWNFVDPTEVMSVAGVYSKAATFTPDDASYDEIDVNINVTVRELASRPTTSVGGGGSTTPVQYTVKFETNGGSEVEAVKVEKGKTVDAPEAPVKENHIFIGWFADKGLTEEFDFDTEIKKATTIYAGWVEITAENSIVLRIDSKAADVFGERVGMDVAPIIVNERTMLPARFVAESLGADVEWDEENYKVTITLGEKVIEVFIDKDYAMVDGEEVELDSTAFIENSRTYLPVRFISEELGAYVNWDGETKTVTITKIQ